MKTLTLKLPEILEARLSLCASKNGLSRSEIVRCAIVEYLSHGHACKSSSFLELSRDLAGCVEGPSDLSTNKAYLKGYGQ